MTKVSCTSGSIVFLWHCYSGQLSLLKHISLSGITSHCVKLRDVKYIQSVSHFDKNVLIITRSHSFHCVARQCAVQTYGLQGMNDQVLQDISFIYISRKETTSLTNSI